MFRTRRALLCVELGLHNGIPEEQGMNFRIATFVLSIILICMISFKAIKKRTTYKKLRNYLAREQYDEFFKLIDAPLTNALYPDYNINYFKLNAYLLKEDYTKANETLEMLLRYPL